jgi:hypothetical protein
MTTNATVVCSTPEIAAQLDEQLANVLSQLRYNEDGGDWFRVSYDGGDCWGLKAVVKGRDLWIDVSAKCYLVFDTVADALLMRSATITAD